MKSKGKWSASLVRSGFSGFLVDAAIEEASGAIDAATEGRLRAQIEGKSQIRSLRQALGSIRKVVSPGTFEALGEELKEIVDDFTWKRSDRGRYVTELNDWLQTFYPSLRKEPRFAGLFVGAHAELEVVYVAGSAQSDGDLAEYLSILKRHHPPRKILTHVTITS